MWILIRFGFVAFLFLVRMVWRRQGVEQRTLYGEYPRVLLTKSKNVGSGADRQSVLTKLFWGLEVRTPLVFSLHHETSWDRVVKWFGLAREVQTGDAEFDREVYVTGDHPALHRLLAENPRLRGAIRQLLARTARRIFSDGHRLWVDSAELSHASNEELQTLAMIAGILRREGPPGRWVFDRFLWTAMLVEVLVWSVAFYGAPGVIEQLHRWYVLGQGPEYFDLWALAKAGLIAAGVALAGMSVLVVLLLRGSSRGHRVLAECFLVMLFGLPFAGIQAVADFNRSRDQAAPQMQEYRIAAIETYVPGGNWISEGRKHRRAF